MGRVGRICRFGRAFAAGAATAAALACGGSGSAPSPNPGAPACTASATSTTITISGNTVCPQNITVPPGTRVTFVNQDTIVHEMVSDPHPEHTDCPELNQVGNLEVGASRSSGNLNTRRRCGFHDHLRNEVAGLKGSITIQ
jgi:plastocyanin